MIANIYGYDNPTPQHEEALHQALLTMSRQEGHIDSKNRPILTEGFRYERSVMEVVQHVADEGGIPWQDRSRIARRLADRLEYTSSANLMATVREAVAQGMLKDGIKDGVGWLAMTSYGWEMLELFEGMDDD